MILLKIILFMVLSFNLIIAQKINIVPSLKKIEHGKIAEAKNDLIKFKKINANNPEVIFLDAVLTEDGAKAQKLYNLISTTFPSSKFADASLFRSFSYYYALGLYKKASEVKTLLTSKYPNSPYLKNTDRIFPLTDEVVLVNSSPYQPKNYTGINYTVQAGAFGSLQNAEKLKNKLLQSGYHANIKPKVVDGKTLHIVTVGSFSERSQATTFLDILKNKYNFSGRVVTIKNSTGN